MKHQLGDQKVSVVMKSAAGGGAEGEAAGEVAVGGEVMRADLVEEAGAVDRGRRGWCGRREAHGKRRRLVDLERQPEVVSGDRNQRLL